MRAREEMRWAELFEAQVAEGPAKRLDQLKALLHRRTPAEVKPCTTEFRLDQLRILREGWYDTCSRMRCRQSPAEAPLGKSPSGPSSGQ